MLHLDDGIVQAGPRPLHTNEPTRQREIRLGTIGLLDSPPLRVSSGGALQLNVNLDGIRAQLADRKQRLLQFGLYEPLETFINANASSLYGDVHNYLPLIHLSFASPRHTARPLACEIEASAHTEDSQRRTI